MLHRARAGVWKGSWPPTLERLNASAPAPTADRQLPCPRPASAAKVHTAELQAAAPPASFQSSMSRKAPLNPVLQTIMGWACRAISDHFGHDLAGCNILVSVYKEQVSFSLLPLKPMLRESRSLEVSGVFSP